MAGISPITVVKVGGSLAERSNPAPVMRMLSRLGAGQPIIVVPGGAGFAEEVRRSAARFGLSDLAAHRMALLGMDQFGLLLADIISAPVSRSLTGVTGIALSGRTAVLLPAMAVETALLPASWDFTSDSVAAWVAAEVKASQLILLKDVDGLFDSDPRRSGGPLLLRKASRSQLKGIVDPCFAHGLPDGTRCWLINGQHPDRLVDLLCGRSTIGTEVIV